MTAVATEAAPPGAVRAATSFLPVTHVVGQVPVLIGPLVPLTPGAGYRKTFGSRRSTTASVTLKVLFAAPVTVTRSPVCRPWFVALTRAVPEGSAEGSE